MKISSSLMVFAPTADVGAMDEPPWREPRTTASQPWHRGSTLRGRRAFLPAFTPYHG